MIKSKLFTAFCVLILAFPSAAETLAHPDVPILKACASDMKVDGTKIAQRILDLGWTEVENAFEDETTDVITRSFEHPKQFGIARVGFENSKNMPQEDGFWGCEIWLNTVPNSLAMFMDAPPEGFREVEHDGIFVGVESGKSEVFELLSLLPFMSPAKLFYAEYKLAKNPYVERINDRDYSVVFYGSINVIYPF